MITENLMNPFSIRSLALISVLVYIAFDYLDGKRVKDEREELIQLKSLKFAHQASLGFLTLFSVIYALDPLFETLYIFLGMILAALYTEILAKIYYRSQL